MIGLLLTLSLALAPEQGGRASVDPKRVEAASAELDAAFKTGKSEDRVRAITNAVDVVDGKVIEGVERGLRDSGSDVRRAAIEALGRMDHPRALEALHGYAQHERSALADDEVLYPALLRAIGRHGNTSSVEVLASDPFTQRKYPAIQARILGLGNIRSEKAVEALFELLQRVGPNQADRYMDDFRLALVRLTGEDRGKASEQWLAWWRDQKSYKLPATPVELRASDQMVWDEYWGKAPAKKHGTGGPRKKGG